ncbi:50S ribosomal protein L13 [Candidatus Adlerbacteria bacterium RIFCSPHIGHO2_12_FULL_53_18]|uniref:Large ribosomal subunit protein uL13 n=1 Tax=Candidatus Adlerbacteria bacterium RIFCSPHIGHO2_12_FULL_53_18 TaxID=1797242 RepID=A0A1F4XVN4_9BACT|nr:MAG: 50S ribosomal protein L13 [Candidatus Adlerbacteria bacterium RIFCSPHIGHO2_12_FULL_53_18]
MITIDAQDKTLGRVASEAAKVLIGKHKATFVKNAVVGEEVTIINASKVRISGDKARAKTYVRYSGYPGGQKIETYAMLTARRGEAEAIRRAVLGMLPKNKLQTKRIKLLTIKK